MYSAEDIAAVYLATFATTPRHSVWQGEHWLPQASEPAPEAVVAALAGDGPPLSVYFLTDDSTTHVAAIDVDNEDGWETVTAITRTLTEAGVTCYPERSRRGGHLWIVADRALPAIAVRYALMVAVERAGFDPADKNIELRPDKDRHISHFAGGALRAPWMAHPATGERYGLLHPATMQPLHQKVAGALLKFQQADHRAIIALAERFVPRNSPQKLSTRPTVSRREPGSVTAALAAGWGVLTTPGRSVRCPLHDDTNPSLKVAPDDQRAWCWSPSCVLHENGRGVTAWRLEQLAGAA